MTKAIRKTDSSPISKLEWSRLDNLYSSMRSGMLDWCIAVAHLEDRGDEIADHYGLDASAVSRMIRIGDYADKFLINNQEAIINLPSGYNSLYELSFLSKSEVKKLCKMGVPTQKAIQSVRRDNGSLVAAPKPLMSVAKNTFAERIDTPDGFAPKAAYMFNLHYDEDSEHIKIVAKHWKQKYHPDKQGGSERIFKLICKAEKELLELRSE